MAQDSDVTSRVPRRYPFSRNRLEPDPQYAELRAAEPVCRVQMPYGPPAWLVTDYHLARLVFGDARFSRAATVERNNPRAADRRAGGRAQRAFVDADAGPGSVSRSLVRARQWRP
jgi:cytochrome P450